jgi:integrase
VETSFQLPGTGIAPNRTSANVELRDKRSLEAFLRGKNDISEELAFPSPEGSILDPDNLYRRYFQPVLSKAGLCKIRLHDLRHTFGSLLIQSRASVVYVKEQMGHSSIQVTVDIYGHLIPGGDVCFVDRLDGVRAEEAETTPQPPRNKAKWGFRRIFSRCLKVLVAAVGLEPTTYGL